MNLRDPLNLRDSSSALNYLRHGAASFQQRAVQTSRRVLATVQDNSKKFDDLDEPDSRHAIAHSNDAAHAVAMSYALPHSGPTQRHHTGTANGDTNGGIGDKMSSYFGGDRKASLPLYKDKPFSYPTSTRQKEWYKKRRLIAMAVLILLALAWLIGLFSSSSKATTTTTTKIEETLEQVAPPAIKEETKSWFGSKKVDWDTRAEMVRDAFRISWAGYEKYGWGYDEFKPRSKSHSQMTPDGLGWIIVDALDTMMIMNLTTELEHARGWLANHTYDQDHDVNTFETTIRMLGGLLSAHYLSTSFDGKYAPTSDDYSEDLYIEKASDLADRLLGAYESDSGIPFASVNLHRRKGIPSHADGGASSTAEATSLQLEMKYLAKITGEELYWKKAEKIMQVIDGNNARDGLVPIFIYADRGVFREQNIRLGSRGDSYYEYLVKQYLQTSEQEPVYDDMWTQAFTGVKKHLLTYSSPSNFLVLGEKPDGLMGKISPKVDHLVCFMPGTIALSVTKGATLAEARKRKDWGPEQEEDFHIAEELMKTCWGMYKITPTGLAPEIVNFHIYDPPKMFNDYKPSNRPKSPADFEPANGPDNKGDYVGKEDYIINAGDRHNLQRPETIESLFYMWRITGDEKYRNWGWQMFKSFIEWSAVDDGSGFTSIADVTSIPPLPRDNMESFWLAETLKYFYLLFGKDDVLPLADVVFNTEAHPLPRFQLGKLFKTGWTRPPRDSEGNIISSSGGVVTAGSSQLEQLAAEAQILVAPQPVTVAATQADTKPTAVQLSQRALPSEEK